MKHLFGLVIGLTTAQTHSRRESNDCCISDLSKHLDSARAAYVPEHESNIQEWRDVEADEVDLAKEIYEDAEKLTWHQWAGIVETGRPSSLVLFRTNGKQTGPISKTNGNLLHNDGCEAAK